jgi:predicted 3-demethylubiquinone-9 3-methyltransferase (glyoxalase superfamily)
VHTVDFQLFGRPFSALNGGPQFPHSEAVSFQVRVETQEDVDLYWNALTANGGQEGNCGWCKDPWGVSWQIIPSALGAALSSADSNVSKHAFEEMMQMKKIVIANL